MQSIGRQLWRRLRRSVPDEASLSGHQVISIEDLLLGPSGGGVQVPFLPVRSNPARRTEERVDFVAASVLERIVLGALVRQQQAKRIFEIGTFRGVTAAVMAANAPEGAVLFTLDLPPDLTVDQIASRYYGASSESGFHLLAAARVEREIGAALREYRGECEIVQLFGDSAKMDFQPYQKSIDLFFVDGCHEYRSARHDTLTAWMCLRQGGLIVWHDYHWESVRSAVRDAELGVPITRVQGTSLAFARKNLP